MPAAIPRPASVRLAANLLFAAVAISFFGMVYSWALVGISRLSSAPFLLTSPLLIAIWVVVTLMTLQGQNWARIIVAIGIAWSAISLLTSLRFLGHPGLQYGTFVLPWITFALRLYGGYLLFKPGSNVWFR